MLEGDFQDVLMGDSNRALAGSRLEQRVGSFGMIGSLRQDLPLAGKKENDLTRINRDINGPASEKAGGLVDVKADDGKKPVQLRLGTVVHSSYSGLVPHDTERD